MNTQINSSQNPFEQQPIDRRAERRLMRAQRHGIERTIWALVSGLALIVLGGLLLMNNLGLVNVTLFENWWALFILIPAGSAFVNAYAAYRQAGQMTNAVMGSLWGGALLTFIACMFLLELDWALLWPTFIILLGVGMLTRSLWR